MPSPAKIEPPKLCNKTGKGMITGWPLRKSNRTARGPDIRVAHSGATEGCALTLTLRTKEITATPTNLNIAFVPF